MLKKILVIIVAVLMLVSCSASKMNIIKDTYSEGKILINYPQFENKNNKEEIKTLNKLIADEALKIMNQYDIDNLSSLEIDYEISFCNEKIMSIKYSGLGNEKKSVYPDNIFYTTNIDTQNQTILKLSDVVDIDETFLDKFQSDNFSAVRSEQIGLLEDLSTEELNNKLASNNFYISESTLGISVEVIHVLGDHAEYEIEFNDIDDSEIESFYEKYINEI
ncbi:polysaccharide deacetylase family protein [Vallitalea maricola]|uniref:Uncharacterized protein n=1 Tax=Vallitalea maricola TaxID=3074433 RepID=A0ACB5UF26_9FIRM|nr:hypothetical protein AN2V17_05790 [Vallitalea sp. AN17-2]